MPKKEYWDDLWDKSSVLTDDIACFQNEYLTPEVEKCIDKYCSQESINFLEAGCGLGIWNFRLNKDKRIRFSVGIDISDAVWTAQQYKLKKLYKNVHFLKGDVTSLPFQENSFNFISSFGVIEHFEKTGLPLEEMRRVMADEGIIFLDTPNKSLWSVFNKLFPIDEHEDYYTPQELKAILERSGLEVLEAYAKGFSNSVMTPLYVLYDYNKDSLLSRAYHFILSGLKSLIQPLDKYLDAKYGFYSIVIARKVNKK